MRALLRAIIVDDSDDDVELILRELRRGGFDPVYEQVSTSAELEVALTHDHWDVVIAEYEKPPFSGMDALRLLRERDLDLSFLFVSDVTGEGHAVEAIRAGAQDYIAKHDLRRLVPAIERELQDTGIRRARGRAERALRESQTWYQSLVETSPDAIIVTDLDGRLFMANQRAVELRGCACVDDLIGKVVFDFLIPEDRRRALVDARHILEIGNVRDLEYTMLREDGMRLSIELGASVIPDADDDPAFIIAVLRDITKRVIAQDELRYLKELNEGILQTMAEGIVVQDAQGNLSYVNPAAATLLGYSPEELIGRPAAAVIPYDQHHIIEAADKRRLRGEADRYELELVRRDGERVLVLVSGSPRYDPDTGRYAGTIAVFTDITGFKQTEAELRQRNRELDLLYRVSRALSVILDQEQLLLTILSEVRRVLNVAATSLWLIDPETNEVVCQEATGPQRETVRGWRLAPGEGIAGWVARQGESLIVPDTRSDPRHFKGVDQQIGLGARSILSVPLRARQDVIGALQVVDTEVDRFSTTDLTLMEPLAATAATAIENARLFAKEEQRAAELAFALEQQRELDRLKDQFIQNVSHELRTPLGLIQAYAQLLVNGELGDLQPNQYEPIAVIARRTQMLSKIVEYLTAILETETQKVAREPVYLTDLVQKLLVDFRFAAENAGLNLEAQVEPDLPPVVGDPTHLNQVLDNLLGNALKFTPTGGTIAVSLAREDDFLILEVSDTGVGIPSDQLDRVFERFYQVDGSMSRRYGGAGLGLALVKQVVEAHGGSVSVQSELLKGSTFTVSLPTSKR
jgi:PAS domain S-box-containing protein